MSQHEDVDEIIKQFGAVENQSENAPSRRFGFAMPSRKPLNASQRKTQLSALRRRLLDAAEMSSDGDFLRAANFLVRNSELSVDGIELESTTLYYQKMLALFTRRLSQRHAFTNQIKMRYAECLRFQKKYDEALPLNQQAYEYYLQQFGATSAWSDNAFRHLEMLLQASKRDADAEKIRRARWLQLPLCEHLQPLEQYIVENGAEVLSRSATDSRILVDFDCCFTKAALQAKFAFAPCVHWFEEYDGAGRSQSGQGFMCDEHQHIISGLHPKEYPDALVIS